jgi:hypothetical protein
MKEETCNKKPFKNKWVAKKALSVILKNNGKTPWRDEITIYKCDICAAFHLSSVVDRGAYTPKKVKDKGYFEIQKEKWGEFLHKYSKNNAVIQKRNKKYST